MRQTTGVGSWFWVLIILIAVFNDKDPKYVETPKHCQYEPKVDIPRDDLDVILGNVQEFADRLEAGIRQKDRARAKCRYIWEKICEHQGTPERFDSDVADHFVDEHYAAGHDGFWLYSLVYCWSGSSLLPSMANPPAYGLVDTWFSTHAGNRSYCTGLLEERGIGYWDRRVLLDPYIAVRLHCIEVASHWDHDDPLRTLRGIFLPKAISDENAGKATWHTRRANREQVKRWSWRLTKAIEWGEEFERIESHATGDR